MNDMTPAPISVERLAVSHVKPYGLMYPDPRGEYVRHSDYAALLDQLAEREANLAELRQNYDDLCAEFSDAVSARVAAERAREGLQAKLDAMLEVGPILSECRWFLVDMHIWPPETTCAMSVDLLPKVDDVIVKVHAALGHPASTTDAAFLAASRGKVDG